MAAIEISRQWDEAMSRLMAFLAALQIGGVEHRTRVALSMIDEARRRHVENSQLTPVEHTMDIAVHSLEEWFGEALENVKIPTARRVAAGIVGLRVTDAAQRWPGAVLGGAPSAELKAALARVSFRTGPDLAVSSMTPRTMDYGAIETIAQETLHRFEWAPLVRAAVLWAGIFFAALAVYDRFFITP